MQDEVKQFNLTILPCPPGHVLHITDTMDEYECKCDSNNENIVKCVSNENKLILEVGIYTVCLHNYIHVSFIGRPMGSLCKQWFSE